MKRVLATPRKTAGGPEAAYAVATQVATQMQIDLIGYEWNPGSGQMTIKVPDLPMERLQRFTRTLREEHRSTFTHISKAQKA